MTKAYVIGQISITNPEAYAVYATQVPQTISAFGGQYLVRGGHATQVEGTSQGDRNVVIEFPSREAAEAWYASDAYQSIINHRINNATGSLVLVDGYAL
jgi:uncharacterized protein (DUF1330 family)